jgi:glycogen debranching enzyme
MTRIGLRARGNQHYVYSGQSILVTNLDGRLTGQGTEGFYDKNTRFLSIDEVLIDGVAPRVCAVSPVQADTFLAYYEAEETERIPAATLYLEERRAVGDGLRTELQLTNYDRDRTLTFDLSLRLEADFADSDEAETGRRRQTAPVERRWDAGRCTLELAYCHSQLKHRTVIEVQGAPSAPQCRGECLVLSLSIEPQRSRSFVVALQSCFDGAPRAVPGRVFPSPDTPLNRLRQALRSEMPRLSSSNQTVSRAWRTAVEDLASLPLGLEGAQAVPVAGLPLYQQFFGRDSLTISWQALMATKRLLRDSLLANAAWQGTRIDDFLDEEPGKMIHQARWGPLSALRIDAFERYFGDWATPVDFLVMLGQYLLWTNDVETTRKLLPAAKKVVHWTEYYGDKDGDGFLEYETRSPLGVKHQGWKDSDDAIVDARGNLVEPPIAACEIQGYWYAGLQQAAVAFLRCGDAPFGLRLLRQAASLRSRFEKAFWMEDEGFYTTALGRDGHSADAVSSNAGHLLAAGIISKERASKVAGRLLEADMFSGWGIRTLTSRNPFYNPFSYHRGSVWPVEQGTIAFGLARYGLWEQLHTLARGVFELTDLFADNRLPEVVGGIQRDDQHPHPGLYPNSCEPQGWSASAIVLLVQSLLGMRAIAPLNLLVIDPHLPEWLPELRLEGLTVGAASVDIEFRRTRAGDTSFRVLNKTGSLHVVRQPVPDGPQSSLLHKGKALLQSVRGL